MGIIKAYAQANKRFKKLQLVLYGPEDYRYPEVSRLINELKLKKVIFTGFISDELLPLLYNQAELFLFPSLYEGFGLPALESMACGTPVVTSNTSSLPEVVGEAAIKINPNNFEEITQAIIKILTREKLRKDLVAKGFRQIKRFSWERVGQETKALYDDLLQRKGKRRNK